jgi:hypothetical protein
MDSSFLQLYIHYIVQVVLTGTFGLLFFLVTPLLRSRASKTLEIFERLQKTFIEFNAYAIFTIVISGVIKISQSSSLYGMTVLPEIICLQKQMFALNLLFSYDTSNSSFKTYLYILYYGIVAFLCYRVQGVASNLLGKDFLGGSYNRLKLVITVCEDISTQGIDARAQWEYEKRWIHYSISLNSSLAVLLFYFLIIGRIVLDNRRLVDPLVPGIYWWIHYVWNHKSFRIRSRIINTHRGTQAVRGSLIPSSSPTRDWVFTYLMQNFSLVWELSFNCALTALTYVPIWSGSAKILPIALFPFIVLFFSRPLLQIQFYLDKLFPHVSSWFNQFIHACKGRSKYFEIIINYSFFRRLLWSPFLLKFFALDPFKTLQAIGYHRVFLAKYLQTYDLKNEWNVGQVAALLAWLPFLIEILRALLSGKQRFIFFQNMSA